MFSNYLREVSQRRRGGSFAKEKKKKLFFCELNALPEMAIRVNAGFQTRDLA